MQGAAGGTHPMEVLSPKSSNVPFKARATMKKSQQELKPKVDEKPTNPDRIDDKWRPPVTVTEPGENSETYFVGRKLGKGGFAVCFEGRSQSHSKIFALKVVKAQVQQKKMMEKFRTEMQIHAKMRHPNIVEFLRAFTLDQHTYVVLELCENGSLTDMVKARSCLSLPEVRRYMLQICGGVKYMHRRSVIHRDLKMGNIFLDANMNLKIGDFGLAAVMADDQDRRTTLCGTPNYIAPEILSKSGSRGHDFKVDTWAIGVICYAMLMGTPPFQSKTQQEIYTKLRTLEYEWKVDSINYIPQEAKDFVASCLNLVAAERPDMDELAEHDFMKMGVIADTLDMQCLTSKPRWLEAADPRGDRVRPGYGITHESMCRDCGIGKGLDGRPRPAVGGKAKISALVEIEAENRLGCAPTTPLPEGILYKQFVEAHAEWVSTQKFPLSSAVPRSRKAIEQTITESAALASTVGSSRTLEQTSTVSTLPHRPTTMARPVPSFAAQQRQQALPKPLLAQSSHPSSEDRTSSGRLDATTEQSEAQGYLRARPVRAASIRSTRSATLRKNTVPKSSTLRDGLGELADRITGGLAEEQTSSQHTGGNVVDGTLSTKSRTLRGAKHQSNASMSSRPMSNGSGPLSEATRDELQETVSGPRSRHALPRPTSVVKSERENRPETPQVDEIRSRTSRIFKPRMIDTSENYTELSSTSQSEVLRSLQNMYGALGPKIETSTAHDSQSRADVTSPYPRVDKWVDYATKHGIAYILTDGSLGMILKSKDTDSAASSCIVVRHARAHTVQRARGLEQQFVPQGKRAADVEFYEQTDALRPMKRLDVSPKRFALDLKKHSSQSSAANALLNTLNGSEAQRMKEVGLLDKFGKYMNKQMGASDTVEGEIEDGAAKEHFIHFYQRLGNVGVWRFADGGLQFNFPDHTKLVLYHSLDTVADNDGLVDVIYLDPRDAKELSSQGVLTNEALERRAMKTFHLSSIRDNGLRRSEMEIVRTNEIREKLSWIRAVIGCWIKEGALGWTGEEKLGWSGTQERRDDKRIKLQWVTVGRPGGDDEVNSSL